MNAHKLFDLDSTPDSKLLHPLEVARELGVSQGTLNIWRCVGRYDIPYIKIGRLVRYRAGDIKAFVARRTR
ncbi:MAG: helix-turn-helix domain-containing protein [Methylococcales bacterium]